MLTALHGDPLKLREASNRRRPPRASHGARGTVPLLDRAAVWEASNSTHISVGSSGGKEPVFSALGELEGIRVHKLSVQGRPVLWSCASPKPSPNAAESKKENKSWLLSVLLRDFRGMTYGTDPKSTELPSDFDIILDRMGKPFLVLNDSVGPGISFTHCNGMTWAAMTDPESNLGIDAARAEEFQGDYPIHRVFRRDELDPLPEKTKGDRAESAAMVWSAKEAFVKAIGCAFHLFSPLEVSATPLEVQPDHSRFLLQLLDKALERFPFNGKSQAEISSFRFADSWVSVAAVGRNYTGRTS